MLIRFFQTTVCIAATCAMLAAPSAHAADAHGDPEALAFYEKSVKPILADRCFKCHGRGEKIKGGLAMITRAGLLKGGDFGPAIDPKQPEKSLLLEMISYKDIDHEMPPKGKLPDDEIAVLRKWVKLGAPMRVDPQDRQLADKLEAEAQAQAPAHDADYWAYQPVKKPTPPQPKNAAWVRQPLDAFILAKLEAAGLQPNPPADRIALIRRATYDLTGLPPTPEEIDAFVNDTAEDAYDKLIDRLLSSPHYGEKWGRHWLDLVRYAETNGYERDSDKPHAWRYRDYVIRSFNDDKPYDRFLIEQLAGDELPDADADAHTATGYYRLGIWDDEPADRKLAKYDVLDGIVSTTGNVMLGMSIGCARCHDHKKDPIKQSDYYSMLAFFHNITPMSKGGKNVERVVHDDPVARAAHEKRVAQVEREVAQLEAEFKKKIDGAAGAVGGDLQHLRYRFYRDTWKQLPKFDELKAEDEGQLPHGLIDTSLATRPNFYGFVYEGELKVPRNGRYRFHLNADDGVRLLLNGKQVFEWDGIHGLDPKPRMVEVALSAGGAPFRLEYFQAHGGRGLSVAWSGPGLQGLRPLSKADTSDTPLHELIRRAGPARLGKARFESWNRKRRELEQLKRKSVGEKALVVTEHGPQAPDTFVLKRGNPDAHGAKVPPAFPSVLGGQEAAIPSPAPGASSSGRRLALARWIASPDNPMTARVMVNRLWQYHFGRGIVGSSNDFGKLGEQPTHPELLDWLATRFIESGWRLKAMHKMIMTSSTYRMASTDGSRALAKDPANALYWRFNMRRLTAEEIRDSILAVNGSLNRELGGPSVYPPMPAAVLATSSRPGAAWGRSSPEQAVRRSIYVKVKRSIRLPILASHDQADTDNSTAVRFSTTVPTQALTMLNSEFMHKQATALAEHLREQAGADTAAQVQRALRLTTGRRPTQAEIERGVSLIRTLEAGATGQSEDPLQRFCLLTLNLNEFVYLD